MIRQEVRAGPRHERRQTSDEVQRLESDRGGSIAPVAPQRVDHAPIRRERETLGLERRTGDVPAEALQSFAVLRLDPHFRVQRELLDVAAQLAWPEERAFELDVTPPAQPLRTSSALRPQRHATLQRCRAQALTGHRPASPTRPMRHYPQ